MTAPTTGYPACSTRHGGRGSLWILGAITLLGGALRFYDIGRPALWGDEAMVFGRTAATYQDLLNRLQIDGFAPLLYELYWVLLRWFEPTPPLMRSVPAIAGTLMIPAMYFLARELAGRRAALLTAALTAVSAYMLNYSRDAKMYMPFWLFIALHAACLLWWLRTARRVAWLAWIAAGLAMVGLHTAGLIIVGIETLMLLTHPRFFPLGIFRASRLGRNLAMLPLFIGGLAIVAAGPAGYYLGFNKWVQRTGGLAPGVSTETDDNWNDSGLQWIEPFHRGRTSIDLLMHSTTALLYAYEWPKPAMRREKLPGGELVIPSWISTTFFALVIATAAIAVLGAMPWRSANPRPPRGPPDCIAWWRRLLWLSVWIVVPTYGFYCRSVDNFMPPTAWIDALGQWLFAEQFAAYPRLIRAGLLALPPLVWLAAGPLTLPRLGRLVQFAAVTATLFGLCYATYLLWMYLWEQAQKTNPGVDWQSIWMPRYVAVVWPAVAVALCLLILRLPTRPLRWFAIGLVLAANLINGMARVIADTEPPVDRMAWDIWVAQDPAYGVRTYHSFLEGGAHPSEGSVLTTQGRYYLCLYSGLRPTPNEFRGWGVLQTFRFERRTSVGAVVSDVNAAGDSVRKVVVWQRYDDARPPPLPPPAEDPMLKALGPRWVRTDVEDFVIRGHWSWRTMGSCRRRQYVRIP